MTDLKKLDKTIKDLDETSNELKEYGKIYKGISALSKEAAEVTDRLKKTNNNLSEIASKLESLIKKQDQQFENVAEKAAEGFFKETNRNLSRIVETIESVIKEQNQQAEDIKKENKENFTLLLDNLKLQLEAQNQHIANMEKTFSLSSDNIQKSTKETLENMVSLQIQLSNDMKSRLTKYLVAMALVAMGVGAGIALYFMRI
ncbi:MAG: hypothetical protein OXF42_07530 [Candidatus Dadabacteria bacterium]|nr:hypothetical protein [Candidatus Dadabacteria bacterium]